MRREGQREWEMEEGVERRTMIWREGKKGERENDENDLRRIERKKKDKEEKRKKDRRREGQGEGQR